jgi:hypothetical protein
MRRLKKENYNFQISFPETTQRQPGGTCGGVRRCECPQNSSGVSLVEVWEGNGDAPSGPLVAPMLPWRSNLEKAQEYYPEIFQISSNKLQLCRKTGRSLLSHADVAFGRP